tara:strand:+ start:545 stop:751 length:207 start_codon:yes stop_codon:yes gene_type:complete
MTIEEESIKFLQDHLDVSFHETLEYGTIGELEWLETPEDRPMMTIEDANGKLTNLVCLFPPFYPTGTN